jgi:hypothetical protein
MRLRAISVLILAVAIMWAAPLVGLVLAGRPFRAHLAFPPRTQFVPHPAFEWRAFVTLSLLVAGALALYLFAIAKRHREVATRSQRTFPWWGWLGLGLAAVSWFFAWHEGFVSPAWRRHVFTPLWLGYILVMNGLTFRRTGWALLTHRTGWFLALFPASAVFWWLFEHLNRFVGNWYYSGIEPSGDWDYFVQGTLPFSTVLPAVASTWVWLSHFRRLQVMRLPAIDGHAMLAWVALLVGLLALMGIGIWPDTLFPMLWLAPLLILCALQQLLLGETLLASLQHGDWRPVLQPALAGLICGSLWELWNYGSLAKWQYSIPYVQRFHLFEMPLLGYLGYLPFGIVCALAMDLVARSVERRAVWPLDAPDSDSGR